MTKSDNLPTALCLMGPTASGKTALAVELVKRIPCEIISVDSAMVYRGMDIGTAKPGPEVLAVAPHRLIDILDPAEAYSAARFRDDALKEMEQIHRQGRLPVLVGGTGLYYRALEQGLSAMPEADPEVRAQLENELEDNGLAALHARLAEVDPVAAARIHPNDPQRIQRALEVYEITGRPMTDWHGEGREAPPQWDFIKLVLAPVEREELHGRIAVRFQQMLEQGFLDEVRGLYARGDLHADMPSMRAVGYRQAWAHLDGQLKFDEFVERGIIATRQYAKRQFTWLRSERNVRWLDADGALDAVLDRLRACGAQPASD